MVQQEGAATAAGRGEEDARFQTRPCGLLGSEAALLELGAAPFGRRSRALGRRRRLSRTCGLGCWWRVFIGRKTTGSGMIW